MYKKILKLKILIIAPVLLIIAALAEPFFRFLFTEKWLPAVPFFQILCWNGILIPINNYNLMVLKSYLFDYEHSFHWMPEYAKKTIEIKDFVTELDIKMLAMINYKHSFIENLIKEPVIKKIGRQPIVPFLVIPE